MLGGWVCIRKKKDVATGWVTADLHQKSVLTSWPNLTKHTLCVAGIHGPPLSGYMSEFWREVELPHYIVPWSRAKQLSQPSPFPFSCTCMRACAHTHTHTHTHTLTLSFSLSHSLTLTLGIDKLLSAMSTCPACSPHRWSTWALETWLCKYWRAGPSTTDSLVFLPGQQSHGLFLAGTRAYQWVCA